MATNSVKVTLQIRHDEAADWLVRNPILAAGEFGLEVDTFWLKIGDGIHNWAQLPYLNKLDETYFKIDNTTGAITFSDSFLNDIAALQAAAGQAIEHLTITNLPVNDTDAANKQYVDSAIRNAGHLKREIVQTLPDAINADPNTLYMVLAPSGEHYEEYMVINGNWDMVGSTGDGGSGGGTFVLEVATPTRLGGVKADDPTIAGHENTEYLSVTHEGFMTLNKVSTSKLFVPTGDVLVLYGGTA